MRVSCTLIPDSRDPLLATAALNRGLHSDNGDVVYTKARELTQLTPSKDPWNAVIRRR